MMMTSAAFLGSCNSVCELASTFLSVDISQLSFPNELPPSF